MNPESAPQSEPLVPPDFMQEWESGERPLQDRLILDLPKGTDQNHYSVYLLENRDTGEPVSFPTRELAMSELQEASTRLDESLVVLGHDLITDSYYICILRRNH